MSKIIQSAIFAVIGILVFTALLIPVVNDGQIREVNTQDAGTFTYYATDKMADQVYTVDSGYLQYNGENLGNTAVHIISDKFRIMFYGGAMTLFDSTLANNVNVKSITINSDGTYTVINTSDSVVTTTEKINWIFAPCPQSEANYIEVLATNSVAKINDNLVIAGGYYGTLTYGSQSLGNTAHIVTFKGTVNNLDCNGYIRENNAWVSKDSTAAINVTEIGNNLYTTAGATVNFKVGDYEALNASAFSLYAPLNYTTVDNDNPVNDMLGILPLILAIALIVGVVAAVVVQRGY